MPENSSRGLRTASEKAAAAIRKHDPLESERFLVRWRSGLEARDAVWQGTFAVAEVRRKGMLDFLLVKRKSKTNQWQAEDLLSRMVDEMKEYRREAGSRLAKEHFDAVDQFLRGLTRKIQAKEDGTTEPSLKALLKRLKREVDKERKTVGALRQQRKDSHGGTWQQFWPELPRKNLVSRKLELDTRLQLELGKMLAGYLRPEDKRERVSLETIARLILLAYLAGGLAYEDTGKIRTHNTDRILRVRNVRDNLVYARLHKAKSFWKPTASLKRQTWEQVGKSRL